MSEPIQPIELDGRTLEGGGQLLRNALCLSSLTGIPIHVSHIRGKRGGGKAGGLKAAHLVAVEWLAKATAATTSGMELGSTELLFQPTRRMQGDEMLDDEEVWASVYENGTIIRRETLIPMSTNGSTLLILQAIFPLILYLPSPIPLRVTIEGGTNVTSSPSIDYISQVFLPVIATQLNIPPIRVNIHRRGWCFGGREVGRVSFDIEPLRRGTVVQALQFTRRQEVKKVHITLLASGDETRDQLKVEVLRHLSIVLPEVEIQWTTNEESGGSQRTYLLLVVEMSSGLRLGRDCISSMKVPKKIQKYNQKDGKELCRRLVSRVVSDIQRELSWEGCVDEYMEDQLVIFEALAHGQSNVDGGRGREASLHTQTAQWIATRILGASFENGKCEGTGFKVVV